LLISWCSEMGTQKRRKRAGSLAMSPANRPKSPIDQRAKQHRKAIADAETPVPPPRNPRKHVRMTDTSPLQGKLVTPRRTGRSRKPAPSKDLHDPFGPSKKKKKDSFKDFNDFSGTAGMFMRKSYRDSKTPELSDDEKVETRAKTPIIIDSSSPSASDYDISFDLQFYINKSLEKTSRLATCRKSIFKLAEIGAVFKPFVDKIEIPDVEIKRIITVYIRDSKNHVKTRLLVIDDFSFDTENLLREVFNEIESE